MEAAPERARKTAQMYAEVEALKERVYERKDGKDVPKYPLPALLIVTARIESAESHDDLEKARQALDLAERIYGMYEEHDLINPLHLTERLMKEFLREMPQHPLQRYLYTTFK